MLVLALVEMGYTQGTIFSLLNSFKSDAADNAHDSTYDPVSMAVTSMFAGDDKNQWLDQVEEEFRSGLSNHDKDTINNSGTTIELDKDAKASLANKWKERTTIWKESSPDPVKELMVQIWLGKQVWLQTDLSYKDICFVFQSAEEGS